MTFVFASVADFFATSVAMTTAAPTPAVGAPAATAVVAVPAEPAVLAAPDAAALPACADPVVGAVPDAGVAPTVPVTGAADVAVPVGGVTGAPWARSAADGSCGAGA